MLHAVCLNLLQLVYILILRYQSHVAYQIFGLVMVYMLDLKKIILLFQTLKQCLIFNFLGEIQGRFSSLQK